MKIAINHRYGGFGLSREAYDMLGSEWLNKAEDRSCCSYFADKRTDPRLIEVIEELGEKASDRSANIVIIEIPDDVDWGLYEYDGWEHVYDKQRVWGLEFE